MLEAAGLLLAAGAGRRFGSPKALLRDGTGAPFLTRSVEALRAGGCTPVVVVLGARASEAESLLRSAPVCTDASVRVVVAGDWAQGMGASLRAGLGYLLQTEAQAALVHLVDLRDVGAAVVERMLAQLAPGPRTLGRASYDGVPGHPVLLGRDHWAGVVATAGGDQGAREYLDSHPPVLVECGDLASGRDIDTPDDLAT